MEDVVFDIRDEFLHKDVDNLKKHYQAKHSHYLQCHYLVLSLLQPEVLDGKRHVVLDRLKKHYQRIRIHDYACMDNTAKRG